MAYEQRIQTVSSFLDPNLGKLLLLGASAAMGPGLISSYISTAPKIILVVLAVTVP